MPLCCGNPKHLALKIKTLHFGQGDSASPFHARGFCRLSLQQHQSERRQGQAAKMVFRASFPHPRSPQKEKKVTSTFYSSLLCFQMKKVDVTLFSPHFIHSH